MHPFITQDLARLHLEELHRDAAHAAHAAAIRAASPGPRRPSLAARLLAGVRGTATASAAVGSIASRPSATHHPVR